MKIKKINKNNKIELRIFKDKYWNAYSHRETVAEFEISEEELFSYDHIFGLYKGDVLVGGYVLNEYPARILVGIPDEVREKIIEDSKINKFAEVSAFWKADKSINLIPLWLHLMIQVLIINPKSYYYSSYGKHKMFKTYKYASTEIVYDAGPDSLCIFKSERNYYFKKIFMLIFFRIIRRQL